MNQTKFYLRLLVLGTAVWSMVATSGPRSNVVEPMKCDSHPAPSRPSKRCARPPIDWNANETLQSCTSQQLDQLASPDPVACGDYLLLGAQDGRPIVASHDGIYIYVPVLDAFGFTARPAYDFGGVRNAYGELISLEPFAAWPAIEIPGVISSDSPPSGWLFVQGLAKDSETTLNLHLRNRRIEEPNADFTVPFERVEELSEFEIADYHLISSLASNRREGSDVPLTTHGVIYLTSPLSGAPDLSLLIYDGDESLFPRWTVGPDSRALFFTVEGQYDALQVEILNLVDEKGRDLLNLPLPLDTGLSFRWS